MEIQKNKLIFIVLIFALSCGRSKKKEIITYYKNGQIETIMPLDSQGNYNGEYKHYFEDGNIKSTLNYKSNLIFGKYITYYNNGNIESITNYDSSTIIGRQDSFFTSGIRKSLNFYLWDGTIYGNSYSYFNNQRVKRYRTYGENSESFDINFDSLGNLKSIDSFFLIFVYNKDTLKFGDPFKLNFIIPDFSEFDFEYKISIVEKKSKKFYKEVLINKGNINKNYYSTYYLFKEKFPVGKYNLLIYSKIYSTKYKINLQNNAKISIVVVNRGNAKQQY